MQLGTDDLPSNNDPRFLCEPAEEGVEVLIGTHSVMPFSEERLMLQPLAITDYEKD